MKNLLNKIRENPLPTIVVGLVSIVLFCVFMIATAGDKNVKKKNGFDETIVFKDLLDDENSGNFLFGDPDTDTSPFGNYRESEFGDPTTDTPQIGNADQNPSNGQSLTKRFMDSLGYQGGEDVYSAEASKEIKEIRRQIEQEKQSKEQKQRIEQNRNATPYDKNYNPSTINNAAQDSDTNAIQVVKSPEQVERERYIAQYKKLQEAKKETKKKINSKSVAPVKVRASIHNNHFIFPGDRVTLILLDDLISQKKIFKKGTLLYANTSFSKNRVLMDITNIQHEPFVLWIEDFQDGQKGMYVEQVADFMEKYSTEVENEAVENTVTEIGEAIPNRLVGGVLSSVGNLFKNKRLKNKDRVELINDHQVFLVNR